MHRVERDKLFNTLYVAIRTAPKAMRRNLVASPADGDAATSALATLICNVIDNESRMVVQADSVDASPYGSQPGKFGVTEPDPCA